MIQIRRRLATLAHSLAAVFGGLLGGTTPWLDRKLEKEEQGTRPM